MGTIQLYTGSLTGHTVRHIAVVQHTTGTSLCEPVCRVVTMEHPLDPDDGKPVTDWGRTEGPCPALILQTISTPTAFCGFSLDRLEFIGDSFLKLATSVRLYCHRKQLGAGDLHLLRQSQISNDNLYRIGLTISLPQIMCTQVFDPSENWSPLRCVGFLVMTTKVKPTIVKNEKSLQVHTISNGENDTILV